MQSGGNATRDSYKYPNSMKMASVGSLHCSYERVHTLVPCPVQSSVYRSHPITCSLQMVLRQQVAALLSVIA